MIDPLSSALLASGVVTAIISAVFSIYTLNQTNKHLKYIENFKNDNTIQTFRYTKLFELNEKLNEIEEVDANASDQKYLADTLNRFNSIEKMYNRAKPIFSKKNYKTINTLFESVNSEYKRLADGVRNSEESINPVSLIESMRKAETELHEIIFLQITELIN